MVLSVSAMNAPKITIGNPTPKMIAFEVIIKNEIEIYMKFMLSSCTIFSAFSNSPSISLIFEVIFPSETSRLFLIS